MQKEKTRLSDECLWEGRNMSSLHVLNIQYPLFTISGFVVHDSLWVRASMKIQCPSTEKKKKRTEFERTMTLFRLARNMGQLHSLCHPQLVMCAQ
ncbi:hypothetical protein RchiOBHm_Chr3g0487501 [Rosa chinensis]|uniref:Uncharacterized protein n=1 Tax=Rosa chinensis TaxID=74649 RepID=A0A2P6RFH8_ROSCH|nr:hypothetical protein RchiOBHm_Chr3g0487501 [Rosa chinensis]